MEAEKSLVTPAFPIILGSASPRRKELLSRTGIPFRVKVVVGDESFNPEKNPEEIVLQIALAKMKNYREYFESHIIICADTIVVADGEVLGKPYNDLQATTMLASLSGQKHDVLTGVVIRSPTTQSQFVSTTSVYFKSLSDSEITHYVASKSPMDKAGAYGIQDWIGLIGVTHIEGDYNNVVGLPVQQLYQELESKFT